MKLLILLNLLLSFRISHAVTVEAFGREVATILLARGTTPDFGFLVVETGTRSREIKSIFESFIKEFPDRGVLVENVRSDQNWELNRIFGLPRVTIVPSGEPTLRTFLRERHGRRGLLVLRADSDGARQNLLKKVSAMILRGTFQEFPIAKLSVLIEVRERDKVSPGLTVRKMWSYALTGSELAAGPYSARMLGQDEFRGIVARHCAWELDGEI